MEREEVEKWLGKDVCIHWRGDPESGEQDGGMIGIAEKIDEEGWLVVDWGYGAKLEYITIIHLDSEPCPKGYSSGDV